jgi:pimeloyl-ACP methyl ester carboxylesterase
MSERTTGDSPALPSTAPLSRRLRTLMIRVSLRGFIAFLGVVALLAGVQRTLMYHPRKGPVPLAEAGEHAPHVREIRVAADDGIMLHGWLSLSPADSPIGKSEPLAQLSREDRLLVLMFAGNAGNRASRLSQLALYNGLGCDALLCDYRGYGENEGAPSESALIQDAKSIWKYVTEELRVPPERVVISGESLGGGVAVALACHCCQQNQTPAALVLRATFSSMVDAAAHNFWWLPVRWVLLDRYPSVDRIPHIDCPRLHYHGDQDEVIPWSLGKQLFEAGPAKSRSGVTNRFLTIPGAGHNDVYKVGAHEITRAIQEFLQEIRRPESP